MSLPELVRGELGEERPVARVHLGGDDELFVTPTRTLVYRAEGLLSDESVEEHDHDAERVAVSESRRKAKFTLEYGLDGEASFSVPKGKLDEVLHPVLAGVLSASGLLNADERFDFSTSAPIVLDDADPGEVGAIYEDLETEAAAIAGDDFSSARSVDMRYQGQTFQLNVEVPDSRIDADTLEAIQERFFERYEAIYGHADRQTPTEAITWRLQAINEIGSISTRPLEAASTVADAVKDHREAYVNGEYVEHTVYDRYQLPPGASFDGPAIIEETESTSIAGPDTTVSVDEIGNVLIHHD